MTPDRAKSNGDSPDGNGDSPDGNGARDDLAVLVTGGAGFIGSHLCERLLEEGHRVWALDNFDDFYDPGRKRKNLAVALRKPDMHLVEGDVRDEILLDGLMSDVDFDAVVHLAALPGVHASLENPDLCYDVNVRGTLRLLEAMRRHSVPALLFGSSAAVYGEDTAPPFREDAAADRPISPYAASKRSGELLCHTHHHLHGLTVYCLRFFTVYGPRQRPDMAIHRLARLMASGQPVHIHGDDGSSIHDYMSIDDAIDGVMLALEAATFRRDGKAPTYELVNLGSGEAVRPRELAEAVGEALHVSVDAEQLPMPSGEVSRSLASVDRGHDVLGFRPRTGLAEGLEKFVRWFEENTTQPSSSDLGVAR